MSTNVNIVVPEVGESIVDARVARWLKAEGDAIKAGEPLVELETDKVDVEVAAPKSGVLRSIAHGDGADVKIGDVLGVIDAGAAAEPPATPSARRLARESSVALADVEAAGPRVRRSDVERAVAGPSTQAPVAEPDATAAAAVAAVPPEPAIPTPTGERAETRERMSKRRTTIARRLVEAQQTAALLTTFNEVDMSAVMALRARHKEAFKATHGVSLGIVSFFVKAAVVALKAYPRLNAEIQGDEMVLKQYYDIGVAVGTPEGLVVPVLRDADRASFADLEIRIRDFATRANNRTLALEDLRGGTFSITNGGVYGSLLSTPIVNPPQVGILGLHAIKERPIAAGGQVVLRPMMFTALTYDHRIVDGAEAVMFLVRIKDLIEDPGAMLVG